MTDYDYFRAPSVAVVLEQMRGNELAILENDTLPLKHIDPPVVLGQLIAFAEDREYDDRDHSPLIWPETGGDTSDGPWVVLLADHDRDVLAGIPAARVPELADRWAGIDELDESWEPDELREVLTQLIDLASTARENDESLFCHIML